MSLPIKGYLKTSLIEWPGKISSVVFVSGCSFRCPFCHNGDLVLNSQDLELISQEELLGDLEKRSNWIDGVVVTGGEPTLYDELADFLIELKNLGLFRMIHTNGSRPKTLKDLFEKRLIDYLSMDIKGPLNGEYNEITGVEVNLDDVLESMDLVRNSGIDYEFRTTVVPTLHSLDSLVKLAQSVPWAKKWYLQQFVPKNTLDEEYLKVEPYPESEMKNMLKAVQVHVPGARLRGI